MSARDHVLTSIRRSLGVTGREAPRRKAVADRIAEHPVGVVPARGHGTAKERIALFARMIEAASGSTEYISVSTDVPPAAAIMCR
jgi:L-lactate dehydrogenase complex protein LldG